MAHLTPEATLSFPVLFTPKKGANEADDRLWYSAALIFDEDAQKTSEYAALKKAALDTAVAHFGADAAEKFTNGSLNWPFLPGPKARAPEGTAVLRVKSTLQPGIVSNYRGPDGRPTPITDPNEMYAGAKVRASLGVYFYDRPTNKGVAFGLNNIQKLADGERLDGRVDAADEFDANEDMTADLSAMTTPDTNETPTPVTTNSGPALSDLL